jgi:hypothetical protein
VAIKDIGPLLDGFRDHSWGVRQAIGEPLTDLIPPTSFFQRADGTYCGTAIFVVEGARPI